MAEPFEVQSPPTPDGSNTVLLIISWLWVGVPLALGVWQTLRTSMQLFL